MHLVSVDPTEIGGSCGKCESPGAPATILKKSLKGIGRREFFSVSSKAKPLQCTDDVQLSVVIEVVHLVRGMVKTN